MAYDQTKDVAIVEGALNNGTDIIAGVYQYNGGEPKIGFKRAYQNKKGETRYGAIGRMTAKEAQMVGQAIAKLMATPQYAQAIQAYNAIKKEVAQ